MYGPASFADIRKFNLGSLDSIELWKIWIVTLNKQLQISWPWLVMLSIVNKFKFRKPWYSGSTDLASALLKAPH
jgi:hypothetical protein